MVELGPHRSLAHRASEQRFIPGLLDLELERLDRLQGSPATPIIGRDSLVTELSMRLDRAQAEIKVLSRDLDLAKGDIAELRDVGERNERLQSFQEKEQRARAQKLDDIQRRLAEVKGRLDHFTSFGTGDLTAYNSFEAVSRKLTELSALERRFKDVEQKLKLSAAFFCGSVLMWLFAVLAL